MSDTLWIMETRGRELMLIKTWAQYGPYEDHVTQQSVGTKDSVASCRPGVLFYLSDSGVASRGNPCLREWPSLFFSSLLWHVNNRGAYRAGELPYTLNKLQRKHRQSLVTKCNCSKREVCSKPGGCQLTLLTVYLLLTMRWLRHTMKSLSWAKDKSINPVESV